MAPRKAKRTPPSRPTGRIRLAGFTLDLDRRALIKADDDLSLTPKECALLAAFMSHPEEVLTRKFLMKEVWDTDYLGDTRTLDVHIRWLREKVEETPSSPIYLKTVRGVGYCFLVPKK